MIHADPGAEHTVRVYGWSDAEPDLRRIRHEVFVVEMHVPEALEWDDADAVSLHALAIDARGNAIGCARLLPDGHIGRVAVLAPWRGRGVGRALLRALVERARDRGDARVMLNAQVAAIPFYERHGFAAYGDVFDEAGIAHRAMARTL
ncbi:MAG TPA: GNAT family N-acetyltransferase [Casimicrobiaceae bacterium]|nr:GNAT family N-acetyltransferase [Casimicrobiaceae bacterium]